MQPRGDQQVLGDALAVERQRAQRVGDAARRPRPRAGRARRGRRAGSARGTGAPRRSRPRPGTRRRAAGRPRAGSTSTPEEPSWSSAERTRAGSFSPVATTTSAPDSSSASVAERARGARRRRRSAAARARRDQLRVQRQAGGRVEDDVARLVVDALDARGQRRVVGQRRADPDRDRVDARAPAVRARARRTRRRSTCESPVRVATLPSSVIADLNSTHGRPVRACLRKAWLTSRARAASSPSATSTSTPSSRRIPRPRPEAFRARVVGGDDDALEARREDRVGAGRRLALMAARLHRDVQRRAGQVGAGARRRRSR